MKLGRLKSIPMLALLGGVVALAIVGAVVSLKRAPARDEETPPMAPPISASAWSYSTQTDQLHGYAWEAARTVGRLSSGPSQVELALELRDDDAKGFFVRADTVLACDSSDRGTVVLVRIDDHPVEGGICKRWNGDPAQAYITPYSHRLGERLPGEPFGPRLASASRVIVELPIWGMGNQQAVFDVAGLHDCFAPWACEASNSATAEPRS